MNKIAVLLTCFNRKENTIKCLKRLYEALSESAKTIYITVYLTDDGNDGTGVAIKTLFPYIKVLQGDGNLFWAGGMRNSWIEAKKKKYDGYLLLNDDTYVLGNLFEELLNMHKYCNDRYGIDGIYIGSTKDPFTQKLTYGGAIFTNKALATYRLLEPDGNIKTCDLGNGNIMLVPKSVFEKIGILNVNYIHSVADYDYSLMAKRKKIPIILAANYCGECLRDRADKYGEFKSMPFKRRIEFLYNPLGLAFPDNLNYIKRNFPYRLPFVFFGTYFKVIFPNAYVYLNKFR